MNAALAAAHGLAVVGWPEPSLAETIFRVVMPIAVVVGTFVALVAGLAALVITLARRHNAERPR